MLYCFSVFFIDGFCYGDNQQNNNDNNVPVSYTHLDVYKRQPLKHSRVDMLCTIKQFYVA